MNLVQRVLVAGTIVLAGALAMLPGSANANPNYKQEHKDYGAISWVLKHNLESRVIVAGTNILTGCLKGGIGAKMRDEGFLEGCKKGMLGGAIVAVGEEVASHNSYPFLGATGKLIHDLGSSMQDNVMRGEGYLSQFQTDFGPLNLTFRDSYIPNVKLTFIPVYGMIYNFNAGGKVDVKQTMYNLTPVFRSKAPSLNGFFGQTIGNVISYIPGLNPRKKRLALSHEMNHALFWRKLRFTGDAFGLAPKYLGRIGKHWDVGQEASSRLLSLIPYNFDPLELEAYTVMKK